MKAPDKLYIGRRNYGPLVGGWKSQPFTSEEIESIEYIRNDVVDEMLKTAEDHAYFAGKEKIREALLEWAKEMKRICKGAKPIEKAYQTVIDKIESL